MLADLRGKNALVTGGSGGIGHALVRTLALAGARVTFTYASSSEKAHLLVEEVGAQGGQARAVALDVRDAPGVTQLCEEIDQTEGRLDILISNAGITRDGLLMAMSDEDWQDVIATNLTGTFHVLRPATRLMMRRRAGAIVLVSSIAARRGGRGHANYVASKGGIEAMTRSLAAELSPRGIRVNCVAPGIIETAMSQEVRDLAGDKLRQSIALGRFGRPEEVASAAAFLASDLASYVTGAILAVDGGM